MDIMQENARLIDARIEAGMAALRERFAIEECDVDPVLANPVIGGRPHHAQRYDIVGLGNLLVMTVKEAEQAQLSSFVITPYSRELPLYSTDYVYSGDKRFFLIELYDLVPRPDEAYRQGIQLIADLAAAWDDMPSMPVQPCWYDDIRPVCIAKAPAQSQDDLAIERFLDTLARYLDFAQAAPEVSGEAKQALWSANKAYADRLVDEGGVSTDLFTAALGAENTRRFFDEVFFAPACYRAE